MTLKRNILLAIQNLEFEELQNVLGVQIQSDFPSLVYKILPDKENFRNFKTGVCSKYCAQQIPYTMLRHRKRNAAELFTLFSRLNQTRTTAGNLFEALCHRWLEEGLSFDRRKFDYQTKEQKVNMEKDAMESQNSDSDDVPIYDWCIKRSLLTSISSLPSSPSQSSVGGITDIKIGFGNRDMVVVNYDVQESITSSVKEAYQQNKASYRYLLVVPNFSTQGLFDSFVIDIEQSAVYFFQVTIASEHYFIPVMLTKWISELEEVLELEIKLVDFGFMVPHHVYHSFGIYNLTIKGLGMKDFTDSMDEKCKIIEAFLRNNRKISLWVIGVDATQIGDGEWYDVLCCGKRKFDSE
jgi:hypothetical protein